MKRDCSLLPLPYRRNHESTSQLFVFGQVFSCLILILANLFIFWNISESISESISLKFEIWTRLIEQFDWKSLQATEGVIESSWSARSVQSLEGRRKEGKEASRRAWWKRPIEKFDWSARSKWSNVQLKCSIEESVGSSRWKHVHR